MTVLSSPRLKLERAGEHITTLHAEFEAYTNRRPHRVTLEIDDEGWNVVGVEIVRPMPESLSLIAGDAAHCLRSALDHIVYAVSSRGSKRRQGYWPICDTEAEYLRPRGKAPCERPPMREEGLGLVPEAIRTIIDGTQPYLGEDRASEHVLGVIRRLDNADKHRVVQPGLAVVRDPGSIDTSRLEPGEVRRLTTEWLAIGEALRLNKKTNVLRWKTVPPKERVNVKYNPSLTIVFGEGGTFDQVWAAYKIIYGLVDQIETTVV